MSNCSARLGRLCGTSIRSLDPLALGRILDVHVLHADSATVRIPKDLENVAQPHEGLAAEAAGGELAIQIPQSQTVTGDVEVGWPRCLYSSGSMSAMRCPRTR